MRLYEDMIAGRISEAEFQSPCWKRRRPSRRSLKQQVVQRAESGCLMKSSLPMDAKQWVEAIQEYANITELDAATLNRLIKEIVVHERIDER